MNNPFLPALISFGPFLLLMFLFLIAGRRRREEVPKTQVVVALAACVAIGAAGMATSFLVYY